MRNFKKSSICFILLLLILISTNAYAIPKPNSEFYIYDSANLLDNSTKEYIINTNIEVNEKTGAQIVWAIINDLEEMDINTYATALFDKWDIGSKKQDNGVLVLIVPDNGELWIEVGYGLEGILPDSRVKRIIEENIVPYFAKGDYNTGVLSGHEEILNYIEKEYNVEIKSRSGLSIPNGGGYVSEYGNIPIIPIAIFIIVFLFIDFRFFRGWIMYSILRSLARGNRYGGGSGGGSYRGGSRGGGGRSGGGGSGGRW